MSRSSRELGFLSLCLMLVGCDATGPQNDSFEQPQESVEETAASLTEQMRATIWRDAMNVMPRLEEMEKGEGPIIRALGHLQESGFVKFETPFGMTMIPDHIISLEV